MEKKKVSLVIPMYYEEEVANECYEKVSNVLKGLEDTYDYEIIFVNDGSKDKTLEILEEINPDIDFENCTTLIDDGLLDSFAILEIVAEINDAFDVEVSAPEVIPENFNSAQALWAMIQRLKD